MLAVTRDLAADTSLARSHKDTTRKPQNKAVTIPTIKNIVQRGSNTCAQFQIRARANTHRRSICNVAVLDVAAYRSPPCGHPHRPCGSHTSMQVPLGCLRLACPGAVDAFPKDEDGRQPTSQAARRVGAEAV